MSTEPSVPSVAAALRALARLGPYFTVDTRAPTRDDQPARPLAELYDTADTGALLGLTLELAQHLPTAERRVAASILFQEVAARLWSVLLGVAAGAGRVPNLPPRRLCWRPRQSGGITLVLPRPTGWRTPGGDPDLAALLWQAAVSDHLVPLHDAVRASTSISARLLWGNAASALVGATQVLASRPALAGPSLRMAGLLLDREPLRAAGSAAVGSAGGHPTMSYTRHSCCLYYRIPGAGICGDCVLRSRTPRRPPRPRAGVGRPDGG